MSLSSIFSLEIPVQMGNLKLYFFINENIRVCGTECISVPHNHGKCYELRYVSAGHGIQVINDTDLEITAGDWILLHPGENHYQPANTVGEDLVQYSFRFSVKTPPESASAQQKKAYTAMLEMLNGIRLLKDENLQNLPSWELLTKEILNKKYGFFNYLQALCTILLTEFLRLSEKKSAHIFPSEELKHSFFWREQIDRLLRYHYMERLKLKDFADAMKVSSRQASRIFIREFGVTYVTKMMETRLQQAKFQLKHTDKSLHQISVDCGFQNYNYFNTCFRKETGMTPADYRTRTDVDDGME